MKIIKDINYLPDYILEKNLRTKKRLILTFWVFVCISVICGFLLAPMAIYGFYEIQIKNVNSQLTALASVEKKANELAEISDISNKKDSLLDRINGNQVRITELTAKIRNAIPYNVYMKSYMISEKNVTMSFAISSPLDTIELIRSLENLNIFEKVTISTFPIVDKSDVITFNLKLK